MFMFWDTWGQNFYNLTSGFYNPFACCGTPFDNIFRFKPVQAFINSAFNFEDSFVYNTYMPYIDLSPAVLSFNDSIFNYTPVNYSQMFESIYESSSGQKLDITEVFNNKTQDIKTNIITNITDDEKKSEPKINPKKSTQKKEQKRNIK